MVNRREFIKLEQIVKRYGDLTVLHGIDLSICEGEFLALLGPSGCGKTSLLGTIAGFVQPTSGGLIMEGRSILNDPPNQRPVNMVFQDYALFPHLTVYDNVAFGPRRHRIARDETHARVNESLLLVGMEKMADRLPSQLSGGQQQRVALARAIVNRPRVLLLDEPMAALDLKLRKRMQLELKRIQEHLGITFIIVTHDQEEALVMADRIAVMSEGRIEQIGSGEEIYSHPKSRFVADFVGEANLIDCRRDEHGELRTVKSGMKLPYGAPALNPTLMLRPEWLDINVDESSETHIAVAGRVKEVIYAGSFSRYYITCDITDDLVVVKNNQQNAPVAREGDDVSVVWRKADGRILTR